MRKCDFIERAKFINSRIHYLLQHYLKLKGLEYNDISDNNVYPVGHKLISNIYKKVAQDSK